MIKQLLQLNLGFPIESNKFVDPLLENLGYVRNHPEIYGSSCVARHVFPTKGTTSKFGYTWSLSKTPIETTFSWIRFRNPAKNIDFPFLADQPAGVGHQQRLPWGVAFLAHGIPQQHRCTLSAWWQIIYKLSGMLMIWYMICINMGYDILTIWYVNDMVYDMY